VTPVNLVRRKPRLEDFRRPRRLSQIRLLRQHVSSPARLFHENQKAFKGSSVMRSPSQEATAVCHPSRLRVTILRASRMEHNVRSRIFRIQRCSTLPACESFWFS